MIKLCIKQSTTKRNKNRTLANLHRKNDLLKTSRPQRDSDYCGFVKSRVARRTSRPGKQRGQIQFFEEKGRPKSAFLQIMKIENGTKIKLFIKVQHLVPQKTVQGSGFEQTGKFYENSIGKSMVSDGPKPLKSIEKQTLFLMLDHSIKQ